MVGDGDISRDVCMFCLHLCAFYCCFSTLEWFNIVFSAHRKLGSFFHLVAERRWAAPLQSLYDAESSWIKVHLNDSDATVAVRCAAGDWAEGRGALQGSFFTGGQRRIVPGVGLIASGEVGLLRQWRRPGNWGEPCLPPAARSGVEAARLLVLPRPPLFTSVSPCWRW